MNHLEAFNTIQTFIFDVDGVLTGSRVFITKNGRPTIGIGSFGRVKRIHHISNPNQIYALKIMKVRHSKEMEYIMKEIELHKTLDHPNIIKCYDFFIEADKTYVILEYASKGDLFKFMIRNSHKLNQDKILKIYVQTLLAFEYLHKRNVLHRDLKPENILMDEDSNVKVCDFGWSAEYSDKETRVTMCGTAEYMAPEVIYHHKQTKKTDVWALGNKSYCFIYSLL